MLYGGIKIAKENSCVVIIDDNMNLYIKHDIIIKNTIEDIKYFLQSLTDSGVTPDTLVFAIDFEYVEDANALKNFINVFEISIYELRIINAAVKGLRSVAITKCENVDEIAAGVAFYLKHFFNEPQSFVDDKYTITFHLQTKYTNIFLVIFFAMMLFIALNGTTHWKAPNHIINSIFMLTCTVFLAHRFFNHKKLYNQPMYRINKIGLTIFVNINLYGVSLLSSPKFISWNDITAIDAYRSFCNSGYYRKGPIDCARLHTKSNLKFAEGKSNSTYEIQFGELGGNAQVELRTLILYWMIFKSI